MSEVRIDVLGPFALVVDGAAVTLPTRKAEALLALLALAPGGRLSRERLCDLLWPRSGVEQARGSLRQALTQLRRALPAQALEATPAWLRLVEAEVDVDAAAFARALAEGSRAGLESANALYRGALLDGLDVASPPFDDWRRQEDERLRARLLGALRRLLQLRAEAGDEPGALDLGERLLALDPLAEESHRALMALHLARGAPGAAMRQYEQCRQRLRSELGVAPAAETEALRRRVLAPPAPAAAPVADSRPGVAVLPFANLSDGAEHRYWAIGFTEEVTRALARFRALRVAARHSAFALADMALPAGDIGRRLGVRYLLGGSVRPAPQVLHVSCELVDADTGHYLWTHRYELEAGALDAGLDDISVRVAGALAVQVDRAVLQGARRQPLENLAVYDCWLRGLEQLHEGTLASHDRARVFFERALELDPGFARAYAGLSLTHFNEWSCHAWERWEETHTRAQHFAERAVALDDADHVTQSILGRILLYRREFERAERHIARAEALNPNDADILIQASLAFAYLGEVARGLDAQRRAFALNPLHDDWYFAFGCAPYLVGRELEQGVALAAKAPDAATDSRAHLAWAYARLGRAQQAERFRDDFLAAFRRNITCGRAPRRDEPARWLWRVNPLRRPEDAAFVFEGLARAGFVVPPDLLP